MPEVKFTCQCEYGHCEFHVDADEIPPEYFIKEFNKTGCPGRVDRCFVIQCDEPSWGDYYSDGTEKPKEVEDEEEDNDVGF